MEVIYSSFGWSTSPKCLRCGLSQFFYFFLSWLKYGIVMSFKIFYLPFLQISLSLVLSKTLTSSTDLKILGFHINNVCYCEIKHLYEMMCLYEHIYFVLLLNDVYKKGILWKGFLKNHIEFCRLTFLNLNFQEVGVKAK